MEKPRRNWHLPFALKVENTLILRADRWKLIGQMIRLAMVDLALRQGQHQL